MLTTPAWAHPPCWVFPKPSVFAEPADAGSSWDYVAAWGCLQQDGSTTPVIEFFTQAEGAAYYAMYASGNFDTDVLNDTYDQSPRVFNDVAMAQRRRIMVYLFKAQPVTTTTKAYKRTVGGTADAPVITYNVVGAVALGVPCASDLAEGGHCFIPQTAVINFTPKVSLPIPMYGDGG